MTGQTSKICPDLRIPIVLSILLAITGIIPGIVLLAGGIPTDNQLIVGVFIFASVLQLVLGALQLISARLISQYRRRGLRLGIFVSGFSVFAFICSFNSAITSFFNLVVLVGDLVLLVYLYRYYRQEPYKSFFT